MGRIFVRGSRAPARLAVLLVTTAITVAGMLVAPYGAAVASGRCNITRGSYTGGYDCDTVISEHSWADGRQETFIVGWDYAVWHIWQRWRGDTEWSGWASLGGEVLHYRSNYGGVYIPSHDPLIIGVYGTDLAKYCKQFFPTYGGWGVHWFSCNYRF
jgi:hypothetical protein